MYMAYPFHICFLGAKTYHPAPQNGFSGQYAELFSLSGCFAKWAVN